MSNNTTALYSLDMRSMRSVLVALVFVAGNIILPQAVHLIPNGGHIWLPIYFFTLVGAYKYGWRVGIMTAVMSPLVNCILFGMPALAALPAIVLKSSVLAFGGAYAARRAGDVSLAAIALAVLFCQLAGGVYEWLTQSFAAAVQDITLGFPGIALQIFGSYLLLRYLLKD